MIKLKNLLLEDNSKKREQGLIRKLPTNQIKQSIVGVRNRMTAQWYGMSASEYLDILTSELKRRGVSDTSKPSKPPNPNRAPSVARDPWLTSRKGRPTEGAEEGEPEERIDEAPSGAAIASALDAIRSEVRHKGPDIQKWLYPHLRKIDNALRKFKRSGS